jgi:hypothetical protein
LFDEKKTGDKKPRETLPLSALQVAASYFAEDLINLSYTLF